jgi:hypothetical protein
MRQKVKVPDVGECCICGGWNEAGVGLRVVSAIHSQEKLRAGISSVTVASTKRVFCGKLLGRVIGGSGDEKPRDARQAVRKWLSGLRIKTASRALA